MNEKELQAKIAKEFGLNEAIKEASIRKEKARKELDRFMSELGKKNGYTNY